MTLPHARNASPGRVAVFGGLVLIAATTLYPLYVMLADALKRRTEYYTNVYGPPHSLYFGNFRLLAGNFDIFGALAHSAFVVIVSVGAATFIAALASFALAKVHNRLTRAVFLTTVAVMLVPGQVLLIPIYLFFARLELVGNYTSLILIYIATSLPFGTFLLTANFRGIPSDLIESAKIDGASMWRIFFSMILPVGRPAVMTLVILNFLNLWNELLLALMLIPDDTKRLLTPTVTALIGQYLTDQPLLMAGLVVSSVPTIAVFVLFSRYLVRGVTVGVSR